MKSLNLMMAEFRRGKDKKRRKKKTMYSMTQNDKLLGNIGKGALIGGVIPMTALLAGSKMTGGVIGGGRKTLMGASLVGTLAGAGAGVLAHNRSEAKRKSTWQEIVTGQRKSWHGRRW